MTLVLARAPASRGFGLEIGTLDDLDRALAGVRLDLVHLRLDAGSQGRQAAAMLIALAEQRGQDPARLDLDLALDPIGAMAATGQLSAPWKTVAARCVETLSSLSQRGLTGKAFLADGRPYHDAGAGEAQELAAVTATGLAYLRALEAGGHALETASGVLAFLLAADADEFLTIAKFRALRRLWARVEEACGLAPRPIRLHAETAWRMTSRRDPWVNMLRATVAAFSAGVGGANSITVLPFTAALGLPDSFARRMARNTQLILLDKSNLWRVADGAAGSGAFEALTGALCETAWQLFQEIEREGGIVASLKAGRLQGRIADLSARRERNIATRRDLITGTSEFPGFAGSPGRGPPDPSGAEHNERTINPAPRRPPACELPSASPLRKPESLVLSLSTGLVWRGSFWGPRSPRPRPPLRPRGLSPSLPFPRTGSAEPFELLQKSFGFDPCRGPDAAQGFSRQSRPGRRLCREGRLRRELLRGGRVRNLRQ